MAHGQPDSKQHSGYIPIGTVTRDNAAQPAPATPSGARVWRFVAAAGGAQAEVALLAEGIARVRLLPPGITPARSWAVIRADADGPAVAVAETPLGAVAADAAPSGLALTTTAMRVEIATDPLRVAFRWPDGAPFAEDDAALGMGVVAAPGAGDIPDARAPGGACAATSDWRRASASPARACARRRWTRVASASPSGTPTPSSRMATPPDRCTPAEPPTGQYAPAPRPHTVELRLPHAGRMDGPRPRITSARLDGRALPADVFAANAAHRYEARLSMALGRVVAPYTLEVTVRE